MPRRRRPHRLTTTQRGLGHKHQKERAALLPYAYGKLCPLGCGKVMRPGMKLELDHVIPRALNGHDGPKRIVCASCNRSRGAKLRHQLARQAARSNHSRDW